MPRRKPAPKRADADKQKSAAWSMLDLRHERTNSEDGALLGGSADGSVDSANSTANSLLGGSSLTEEPVQPFSSELESSSEEATQIAPIQIDEQPLRRFVSFKDAKKAKKKAEANQVTDEQLKQLLKNCLFHVTFKRDLSTDVVCEIGCFCVHLKCPACSVDCECEVPEELPGKGDFWFYPSLLSDGNLVYFETIDQHSTEKKVFYYKATTDLPQNLAKCLDNAKFIDVFCAKYSGVTKTLYLSIKLRSSAVRELEFPSEAPQHIKGGLTNKRVLLAPLVQHYHGSRKPEFDYTDLSFDRKQNVYDLYRAVKNVQDQGVSWSLGLNVQHSSLKPTLRPYQCQGVRWMLYREGFGRKTNEPERLHPLFEEIVFSDGLSLYFNRYTSVFTRTRPPRRAPPSGGILADEMGLGKTVEVLACVLINPRLDLRSADKPPQPVTCRGKVPRDRSPVKVKASSPTKNAHLPTSSENAPPTALQATPPAASPLKSDSHGSLTTPTTIAPPTLSLATPASSLVAPTTKIKEEIVMNSSDHVDSRTNIVVSSQSHHDHNYQDSRAKHSNFLEPTPRDFDQETTTNHVPRGHVDGSRGHVAEKMDAEVAEILEGGVLEEHFIISSDMIMNGGCVEVETSGRQSESPIVVDDSETEIQSEVSIKSKKKKRKRRWVGATRSRKKSRTDGQPAPKPAPKKPIKERKSYYVYEPVVDKREEMKYELNRFECLCGADDLETDTSLRIQCGDCGLWQHAECMGYDVTDSARALYRCPHCCVQAPPLASGATLIITPSSISHQWVDEILKHIITQGLRVLVYEGNFRQLKSGQRQYIQPYQLANQDMVITSYETLRREINYVDLPHSNSEQGRRFRNPKRFMALPSPITAVQWWRVCLDEAQMVETTTTKAAEMVLRLSAVHRWCVTGTPLQHSVSDLYGLFLFLGLDPFWVKHWWYKLLYEPYCYSIRDPMNNVVADVMRRTMKKDVIDQIDIPAQTDQTHWLQFSPIEELFYRQQYERCRDEALRKLSKIKVRNLQTKLSDLDQNTVHSLLYPLIRLRQACCHPQAVRGAFLPLNRSTMTMSQVLEQLLKKTKLECEERHRELVASLNGLAGLHIIRGDFVRAAETYREVMLSVKDHNDKLRTDELQQLHALHNLYDLLQQKHRGMGRTISDDQLPKRANEIRKKYMEKADNNVENAQSSLRSVQQKKTQAKHELKVNGQEWYCDVINMAEYLSRDSELVDKIKNDLADGSTSVAMSIGRQFRDLRGLQYVLSDKLKDLDHHYQKLLSSLRKIEKTELNSLIPQTAECCLRPLGEIQNTCLFCQAHRQFEAYESRLFMFSEKGVVTNDDGDFSMDTKRQGTWADSELERTLKALLNFVKQQNQELQEAGQSHLKLFELLKKEFKCLRGVWMMLRERVSNHDELSMAVTRLRVRELHEPKPDPPNRSVIEIFEVQPLEQKLKNDGAMANSELKKKLGQLLYIGNLERSQDFESGENPELCPVCQNRLGQKWAVTRCGHCYCMECIQHIVGKYSCGPSGRYIKCAVCRGTNMIAEISYVTTQQNSSQDQDDLDLNLKGDHSSKVTAVVRCLRRIQLREPDTKCLVFSNWVDVLQIIAKALEENGVSYRLLAGPKFQSSLSSFLNDDEVTVLLLPVHSGANGLNLIRATHVLLCEPILNPAQELQAIGRVHRIGQTKETFVHRFVVRSTIEERMSTVLKRTEDSTVDLGSQDEDNMSLGDLYSLFQQDQEDENDGGDVS